MAATQEVRDLEQRVSRALKAELGDRVTMAGGTFDATQLTLRVKISLGNDETRTAAVREQFNRIAPLYSLLPSDFDLPLTINGLPGKLVRIEPQRPKHPFVGQTKDGRTWKLTATTFLAARGRAAGAAAVRKAA
jgi:hypothetical protein